jgi:hypothetical protein
MLSIDRRIPKGWTVNPFVGSLAGLGTKNATAVGQEMLQLLNHGLSVTYFFKFGVWRRVEEL